jgi:transglutaminase-like putative cysteine protease
MVWRQEVAIREYLKPTKLCDCDSPFVKEITSRVVAGASDPREAARTVFRFVRDAIPFDATLDIWQKASQTLRREVVDYCNKVNAQVALLRAAAIPARYRMARVHKEVLKPFLPRFLYTHLPSPVGHMWCECYLEGGWVSCEALFDRPLYQGMLGQGLIAEKQIPTIDWDGDADLVLLEPWIVRDVGHYATFDELVALAQEEGMPPKLLCQLFDWLPSFFSRRRTDSIRRRRNSCRPPAVTPA